MLKAKVKDQLLACAVAFMWTHTGKTERMVFVAKNGLRSDHRGASLYNICIIFHGGSVSQFSSRWGVSKGGLGACRPRKSFRFLGPLRWVLVQSKSVGLNNMMCYHE